MTHTPAPISRRTGFTLVELIVAAIIVAGLTSAVTIAISQTLKARTGSDARQSARIRADAAVSRIALDVHDAVREGDLFHARVLITDGAVAGAARDELLVFSRSMRVVRPNASTPEGAEFEVQYRLAADALGARAGGTTPKTPGMTLWRRVDPIPDDTPDGGGVVSPVVQGVVSLSIEAFDAEAWRASWDSDRDGYPHAVRVIASATSNDGRVTQVARRVIALDRVPLPYAAERPDESDDEEAGGGG
jgi:type II secretion system protein J